jgi:predicted nucleotidyltransferase
MELSSEIKNICAIIVREASPLRVYLFGSFADGIPHSDSDYDFYVVVPDKSDRPALLTENIYRALYKQTSGKPVDILVKRLYDFESRKTLPTIEREVFTKGVVLYENTEVMS